MKLIQKIKNWLRGYSRIVEIDSRRFDEWPPGEVYRLPDGVIVKIDDTDVIWKVYYK